MNIERRVRARVRGPGRSLGITLPAGRAAALAVTFAVTLAIALGGAAAMATLMILDVRGEAAVDTRVDSPSSPELIARGEYLTRVGNCSGCHTAPGGAPWAGGSGVATPFGVVYAGNLTPDLETGLGRWNASHFWRAMHNGRSRDGRRLYPAFPYTHYTRVTRADADAMFAYLRSLPAVEQANRPHALRFPYDTQAALVVWRALHFRPAPWQPQPERDAQWNRGAYLAEGLGHCTACHAPRNRWGAIDTARVWSGALMISQPWYAPSLLSADEGGVAHWPRSSVVELLRDGVTEGASVLGPMAEVVYRSTRHMNDADLQALASYLQALPQQPPAASRPASGHASRPAADAAVPAMPEARRMAGGEQLYSRHCADCHGEQGEGISGAFPALAANRAVTLEPAVNVVRVVLSGGFPPSTEGNPRPHGMAPFGHMLNDEQVAMVLTYVRNAWGNRASEVSFSDVQRYR